MYLSMCTQAYKSLFKPSITHTEELGSGRSRVSGETYPVGKRSQRHNLVMAVPEAAGGTSEIDLFGGNAQYARVHVYRFVHFHRSSPEGALAKIDASGHAHVYTDAAASEFSPGPSNAVVFALEYPNQVLRLHHPEWYLNMGETLRQCAFG